MRILYFCPEYHCNHGARTHARGFYDALCKLDRVSDCHIYPESAPDNSHIQHGKSTRRRGKLRFLPMGLSRVIGFFFPQRKLTEILIARLKEYKSDAIVIRTGVKQQPIVPVIQKAIPGIKVCLEINSTYFDERFQKIPFRSLFQKLEVMRYAKADRIMVVSSYLKDYLVERRVDPNKIIVNQNGVDVKALQTDASIDIRLEHNIPEDAFLIGYIGGMEPFRRLPEVISYIAELRSRGRNVYFIVVGDGMDMPTVRSVVSTRKDELGDAVKLVGWKKHGEVPYYLSAIDLAIFPFTNDYCSPLKLFEYLGAGLPVLGPDTPAVREVFADSEHLMLVKQDGSNFIQLTETLISNDALREKIARAGQRHVLEEYTWENNAKRVVKHIESEL